MKVFIVDTTVMTPDGDVTVYMSPEKAIYNGFPEHTPVIIARAAYDDLIKDGGISIIVGKECIGYIYCRQVVK